MDLSRLMSRLAAIGGMQGAVTEAEEKCTDCGKVHEGDCAVEEAKKPDADNDGIPDWADKDKEEKVDESEASPHDYIDYVNAGGKEPSPDLINQPGVEYDPESGIISVRNATSLANTHRSLEAAGWQKHALAARRNPAGAGQARQAGDTAYQLESARISEMSAMRKLAGITECGEEYADMSPMSVTGTEAPGMGVPAQVMSMDTMGADATGNDSPKAKYTLSIQNGENNLQMTTDMPDEIIHIMKLAGVNKDAEVTKTAAPEEEQSKAPKQEVEEEWGNTPAQTNEREPKAYGDIRDWGMKGTGAGKPGSAMNKPSGQGDNPLGEQAMMEAYKKFKAGK